MTLGYHDLQVFLEGEKYGIYHLPEHKSLAFTKLKTFVGDNLNVAEVKWYEFSLIGVDNIVGKGENGGLPFP